MRSQGLVVGSSVPQASVLIARPFVELRARLLSQAFRAVCPGDWVVMDPLLTWASV